MDSPVCKMMKKSQKNIAMNSESVPNESCAVNANAVMDDFFKNKIIGEIYNYRVDGPVAQS